MDSLRSNEKTGEMGMQKITHPQDNPQNSNSFIAKFTNSLVNVRWFFGMVFPFLCRVHSFKFTFYIFLGQDQFSGATGGTDVGGFTG